MHIYFVPVSLDLSDEMETECTTCLIDIYNDLLPNRLKVIVVVVDELRANYSFPELQRDFVIFFFDTMFSRMPWTAIPFSEYIERIRYLEYEDDEAAKQPSLETLLGSPVRDYVVSNKENRVPIQTLKDKVVALNFYEDGFIDDDKTEDGL